MIIEESDYLGNVFKKEDDIDFPGENISGSNSAILSTWVFKCFEKSSSRVGVRSRE